MRFHFLLVLGFMFLGCLRAGAQVEWRVRNSGTTAAITSIAFGNGVFLATDGHPLRSVDGITWTRPSWAEGRVNSVFYGGGEFIGFGHHENDGTPYLWRSRDGITATRTVSSMYWPSYFLDAVHINGLWFFCGSPKSGVISGNSMVSEIIAPPWGASPRWVVNSPNGLLAYSDSAFFHSSDGKAWTLLSRAEVISYDKPTFANGEFFCRQGKSSDNGKTWSNWPDYTWISKKVIFERGLFVGCNASSFLESTLIYTTSDGREWISRETGSTSTLIDLAFGNNIFVAVGNGGRIITSGAASLPPAVVAPSITITPSVTLKWPSTAGLYYQPETSPDLKAWSPFGAVIPGSGAEMTRGFEVTGTRRYFRLVVR